MSYHLVKKEYMKILDYERKNYSVKKMLIKLLQYILENNLDFSKIYTLLSIGANNQGNLYNFKKNNNTLKLVINSIGRDFIIYFLPNAPLKSLSPLFPIIEIKLIPGNNIKYFQIIKISSKYTIDLQLPKERYLDENPESNIFIDTDKTLREYPYYTDRNYFHDEPHYTTVNFLSDNKIKFRANVYIVEDNNINISVLGGISWGFRTRQWSIQPTAIYPASVSKSQLKKDLNMFYKLYKKHKGERNIVISYH